MGFGLRLICILTSFTWNIYYSMGISMILILMYIPIKILYTIEGVSSFITIENFVVSNVVEVMLSVVALCFILACFINDYKEVKKSLQD